MAYEWVIPAANAAYENRDVITSAWQRLVSSTFGRRYDIAMTGISGVGKTDLFNHLLGTSGRNAAVQTSTSQATEMSAVRIDKRRLHITTVPGQATRVRARAIGDLLVGDNPVEGVIHVVSNGFVTIRDSAVRAELLREKEETASLEGFTSHHRERELQDLRSLIPLIRQASLSTNKPTWLCLAVTKVDLYHHSLTQAEDYYRLNPASPLVAELNDLASDLGRYRFKWFAAPVCASLEPFDWNGHSISSSGIAQSQRNQLLRDLLARLAEECV